MSSSSHLVVLLRSCPLVHDSRDQLEPPTAMQLPQLAKSG